VFGGKSDDRARTVALYDFNVKAVRAAVPKDRLLVHNLGDGWQPRCAHLGVPDQPYLSRNRASEIQEAKLSHRTCDKIDRVNPTMNGNIKRL
jgi:hypothetical protein